MLAVEVRCVPFPSSPEANSYFEEEMVWTFGKRRRLTPIFTNGKWQFFFKYKSSMHFVSKISTNNIGAKFYHSRSLDSAQL